ncbi:glycosyltransferase [Amylibacter sp.]|nr:glycosyltransferase [Amylibacter sp.]
MVIRIIHITAGLWKDTGGPAEVIPNLCRAQAEGGAEVTLCSISGDTAPQVEALKGTNVDVRLFHSFSDTIRYSPNMADFLKSQKDIDIIHNHGHWLWPNWFAVTISKHLNARLITTPHGTLVPGMLSKSFVKKSLSWMLFDRRLIAKADVIHALSSEEADLMSVKLGRYSKKISIIPNGVNIAKTGGKNTGRHGGTLLFLSRVTPIKGIIELLNAWANLSPIFPEWRLKIVGPIDKSIKDQVEILCATIPRTSLAGPIYDYQRWKEYQHAAAFILPTFGEGLPTVLLEAAAHQLPIITTPEANFKQLNHVGGSLLCNPHSGDIEATLKQFFQLPGNIRQEIGNRGAELIETDYRWDIIASRWLSVYSDITSRS